MKKNLIYLITIASILSYLGCLKTTQKPKEKAPMNPAFEAWQNRTIYKVLTSEILDSIQDDDLEEVIFDNIFEQLKDDYNNRFYKIKQMSKGQQAFWATWVVEGEVNNGGFNQFYFNNQGLFSKMAEEGFQTFGATKHAELMKRANTIYTENKEQLAKFNDGTLESFSESYKDNPLNKLDDEFYDLYKVERLSALRIQYIRNHKEEFINP